MLTPHPKRFLISLMFLSWLAMLGIDFFLHGGLLAPFYNKTSPFLLPPLDAFRLIPLGYFSFLLLAYLLMWLMLRLNIKERTAGMIFGLQLGSLTWGAFVLGLLSISTISWSLALAWWLGQTIEMAVAGAIMGWGFTTKKLKPLLWRVLALVIFLFVLTIILQNMGWAPAVQIN